MAEPSFPWQQVLAVTNLPCSQADHIRHFLFLKIYLHPGTDEFKIKASSPRSMMLTLASLTTSVPLAANAAQAVAQCGRSLASGDAPGERLSSNHFAMSTAQPVLPHSANDDTLLLRFGHTGSRSPFMDLSGVAREIMMSDQF